MTALPPNGPPSGHGGVVDAGARVATQVVHGFTGQPALLLILLLNVVMILGAGYYLSGLETNRSADRQLLLNILSSCITKPEHTT